VKLASNHFSASFGNQSQFTKLVEELDPYISSFMTFVIEFKERRQASRLCFRRQRSRGVAAASGCFTGFSFDQHAKRCKPDQAHGLECGTYCEDAVNNKGGECSNVCGNVGEVARWCCQKNLTGAPDECKYAKYVEFGEATTGSPEDYFQCVVPAEVTSDTGSLASFIETSSSSETRATAVQSEGDLVVAHARGHGRHHSRHDAGMSLTQVDEQSKFFWRRRRSVPAPEHDPLSGTHAPQCEKLSDYPAMDSEGKCRSLCEEGTELIGENKCGDICPQDKLLESHLGFEVAGTPIGWSVCAESDAALMEVKADFVALAGNTFQAVTKAWGAVKDGVDRREHLNHTFQAFKDLGLHFAVPNCRGGGEQTN